MKKIDLKRKILVPDADYCIVWNHQKEVCPALHFRKEPKNPKILWKCDFFDKDIQQNITSVGIRKFCMEHKPAKLYNIDGSTLELA